MSSSAAAPAVKERFPVLTEDIWEDVSFLSKIQIDGFETNLPVTKDILIRVRALANRILNCHHQNINQEFQAQTLHLAEENDLYQQRVTTLTQELTDARDVSRALAAAAGNAPAALREKPENMPDPVKFHGARSELRPFLVQLKIKLAANAARFPTAQHALGYAVGLLGGTALAQLIPYVNGAMINLPDMDAFYAILDDAFGDPDRVATATRELENLKQANREFSLYYADFQRLASELDWNDSAKRHALTRGLCNELKDGLVWQPEIADFHGFVRQLQTLDKKWRARIAEQKKSAASSSKSPAIKTSTVPDPAKNPGHPTQAGSGYYGPAPMDLSAGKHISAEEKLLRMKEGRCFYCGGLGHTAKDCPNKKKLQGSAAVVQTPDVSPDSPSVEAGKD